MSEQSAKPYLIRAICEWCADNSLTPYLAVKVNGQTRVPAAFVKNGELYTSDKMLSVPAADKFLQLEVVPDKTEYKPRDPASYTIIARNADGSRVYVAGFQAGNRTSVLSEAEAGDSLPPPNPPIRFPTRPRSRPP